jgi:hypothetical protein
MALTALGLLTGTSHAQMPVLVPTTDGTNAGFSTSLFAQPFPTNSTMPPSGPTGIGYNTDGTVLVASAGHDTSNGNNMFVLPNHTDSQLVTTVEAVNNVQGAVGMAQVQYGTTFHYFVADDHNKSVDQVSSTGAFMKFITPTGVLGLTSASGLTVFPTGSPYSTAPVGPLTGHLFASGADPSLGTIYNINPDTPGAAPVLFATLPGVDGLTFSPDGKHLYAASRTLDVIRDYTISGTTFSSFTDIPIPGSGTNHIVDGIAIGIGSLSGYLFANLNDGDFYQLGTPTGPFAGFSDLIASTGSVVSRGDLVYSDPNVLGPPGPNGQAFPTLLITESSEIDRMDPPGGGFYTSFEGAALPEPSSAVLLCLGLLGPGAMLVRRRAMRARERRASQG